MSGNESAYPVADENNVVGRCGLTKRELFALEMAKANRISHPNSDSEYVVGWGIHDADALLALLSKEPT